MKAKTSVFFVAVMAMAVAMLPAGANANHSWGNYHWARQSNPFTIRVVDSTTSGWASMQSSAVNDWSASNVLNMTLEQGDESSVARRRCTMVAGKVRSCNYTYGNNGWLGLASINISGSHITQGSSKMNDTYFNGGGYTTTNRRHVMCQEIGHTLGLTHTSEDGSDQNTCMDYSNDLGNPSPNSHDYAQLSTIYSHLDSTTTVAFAAFAANEFGDDPDAPHNWGRLISQSDNGRSSYYERANANGGKTLRHVFWTREAAERCRGCDHRYDH